MSSDRTTTRRVTRRSFLTAIGAAVVSSPFGGSLYASDVNLIGRFDRRHNRALTTFTTIDDVVQHLNAAEFYSDLRIGQTGRGDVPFWSASVVKVGKIVPPVRDSSIKAPAFKFEGYGGVAGAFRDDRFLVFTAAHLFPDFDNDLKNRLMGIKLYDGTLLKPERTERDPQRDYLVMEFSLKDVATKIKPLKFFNSARIKVGKTINYIKPSSEGVVSTGTIAPRDLWVKKVDDNNLVTLDAQIERGCSGCPIVDENYYVYGFIKSFYESCDSKEPKCKKSFAVPSNDFLEFAVLKFAGDRIRRP